MGPLTGCSSESQSPTAVPTVTPVPSITEQAATFCEQEVSKRLKAPATAQFHTEAVPDDPANPDAGPWAVTGTVDSENSFGAYIRTPFQCASHREGDQVFTRLVQIDFEPVQ